MQLSIQSIQSLLQVEKDHVNGFAPEVAWVTHGGENKLEEKMCVRPTSETLFCEHFIFLLLVYHSSVTLPYPVIPFNNPNDTLPTITPANVYGIILNI